MATPIASPLTTSSTPFLPALQTDSATIQRIVAGAHDGVPCAACTHSEEPEIISAGNSMTPTTHAFAPILVPLRYRNQVFPDGHIPAISEVPAHFDVKGITATGKCSYHTEYASKCRAFASPLLEGLDTIKASHRKGVPELWTSPAWALEMAEFIFRLAAGKEPPAVIEIHPPFVSFVPTMEAFLDVYALFEEAVLARFPECRFVVENRSGTKHPHDFLLSSAESILALGQALASRNLKLGIALDLPQMFTQHFGSKHRVDLEGAELLKALGPVREQIHTLHLWGRGESGGAHSGGLDGLFDLHPASKEATLAVLAEMFADGQERHLVVEVTRDGDLVDILADLKRL